MTRNRNKHKRRRSTGTRRFWKLLASVHRYSGVSAALFIICISISGILLNHTNSFKLDQQQVTWSWLLNHYHIGYPNSLVSYQAEEHWLTQADHQIYLDGNYLFEQSARLSGAVVINDVLILAFHKQMVLLNTDGELIERIDIASVLQQFANNPSVDKQSIIINAIQTINDSVLIRAGSIVMLSNDMLLSWQITSELSHWSSTQTLPTQLGQEINQQFRHHLINWERVILDLHSGRLPGPYGIYLADISAIILILLSITGIALWIRRR